MRRPAGRLPACGWLATVAALGCAPRQPSPGTFVGSSASADGSGLWATSWVLEDLAGAGVMDYVRATLKFLRPGKIGGNGSCNSFEGGARVRAETLALEPLASSQRGCPEAVTNQEAQYLAALRGATRFERTGPWLLIYSTGLEEPLRFIAAE